MAIVLWQLLYVVSNLMVQKKVVILLSFKKYIYIKKN